VPHERRSPVACCRARAKRRRIIGKFASGVARRSQRARLGRAQQPRDSAADRRWWATATVPKKIGSNITVSRVRGGGAQRVGSTSSRSIGGIATALPRASSCANISRTVRSRGDARASGRGAPPMRQGRRAPDRTGFWALSWLAMTSHRVRRTSAHARDCGRRSPSRRRDMSPPWLTRHAQAGRLARAAALRRTPRPQVSPSLNTIWSIGVVDPARVWAERAPHPESRPAGASHSRPAVAADSAGGAALCAAT